MIRVNLDKTKEKKNLFSTLSIGTCFRYADRIYVKTYDTYDISINAIMFDGTNWRPERIDGSLKVDVVKATLQIES